MSEILFHYERINPTTWAYVSSLMTIALFFKFSRVWSVRNLDLILLVLLAPGLLFIKYGRSSTFENAVTIEQLGYIWLFVVYGILMMRLIIDNAMVRRPLLEPNMTADGLTFVCFSLLLFLMANVVTGKPSPDDLSGAERAAGLSQRVDLPDDYGSLKQHGPGFPLVFLLPYISTQQLMSSTPSNEQPTQSERAAQQIRLYEVTARLVTICSHLAVLAGMVLIGYRHFDNLRAGIAAATLYLMLPYMALWAGSATHALPAALLVWAVLAYRRPLVAGLLIGLAAGTIYYPVFLLPLWISFYWNRGLVRFTLGVLVSFAVLVTTLAFTATDLSSLVADLRQMFGAHLPAYDNLGGAWQYWNAVYRYPLLAAFVALSGSFAIWPASKNLATLLSCSAALMLGTQYWHAHSGGVAMAWFLPFLLLTIFRPNLEDRVAENVLGEGWRQWRPNRQKPTDSQN